MESECFCLPLITPHSLLHSGRTGGEDCRTISLPDTDGRGAGEGGKKEWDDIDGRPPRRERESLGMTNRGKLSEMIKAQQCHIISGFT